MQNIFKKMTGGKPFYNVLNRVDLVSKSHITYASKGDTYDRHMWKGFILFLLNIVERHNIVMVPISTSPYKYFFFHMMNYINFNKGSFCNSALETYQHKQNYCYKVRNLWEVEEKWILDKTGIKTSYVCYVKQ